MVVIKYLKDKLGITKLQQDIRALRRYLNDEINRIDSYTKLDADVDLYRGSNTIVLTGIYKGQPVVRFYDVSNEEFKHMYERFKEMPHTMVRNIDCPPNIRYTLDL